MQRQSKCYLKKTVDFINNININFNILGNDQKSHISNSFFCYYYGYVCKSDCFELYHHLRSTFDIEMAKLLKFKLYNIIYIKFVHDLFNSIYTHFLNINLHHNILLYTSRNTVYKCLGKKIFFLLPVFRSRCQIPKGY